MTGKRYGYARVSSTDQNLDAQITALKVAGCDIILEEKASGKDREGRPKLALLLEVVGQGDTVTITKLDRLGRETVDMLDIAAELSKKGVGLKSLAEPWADTTTPEKKFMFTVFAGMAEWERNRIRQRQSEGIAEAKKRGVYKGGTKKFDDDAIRQMHASGIGPSEIARQIGAKSTMTVYRALGKGSACRTHGPQSNAQ